MTERERRIRDRAHQMWERDGRPTGQDDHYWFKAEQEIDAEDQDPRPLTPGVNP